MYKFSLSNIVKFSLFLTQINHMTSEDLKYSGHSGHMYCHIQSSFTFIILKSDQYLFDFFIFFLSHKTIIRVNK